MPPRKKTEEVSTDPQNVLDFDKVVEATETELNGQEIQDEIAQLRAELEAAKAQLATTAAQDKPLPDSALSPQELENRKLRDELARIKGAEIMNAEDLYEENTEGGILVHFLEDGLTSNGKSFYRGQEAVFGPEAYEDTKDRYGTSWLNMDDEAQFSRWGAVKFRRGPWPGKRAYDESTLVGVSITERAPIVRV